MVATPQMIRLQKTISLPAALDTRNAVSWLSNMPRQAHHAAEWDLQKASGPVRMYSVAKPGMFLANDKVIFLVMWTHLPPAMRRCT